MPASGAARLSLDVVGERLQRRDVDDLRLVGETALEALAHQAIDGGEEGGERLAGAGGAAISTWRPAWIGGQASACAGGRRGEGPAEPAGNGRVERAGTAHVFFGLVGCCAGDGHRIWDIGAGFQRKLVDPASRTVP